MKAIKKIFGCLLLFASFSCGQKKETHASHPDVTQSEVYTCPMHPEIIRDQPGQCPICGMDLIKKIKQPVSVQDVELTSLLNPANEFVVSSIPVIALRKREEPIEVEALGAIAYDTRYTANISARVSGRIEKLYVKYRYQEIKKGQHIMDIYSPELLTAQQHLLFLLRNDPDNESLISAAKEKLLLLGMEQQQVQQVIKSGHPLETIAVYSNYSGHIHDASGLAGMNNNPNGMKDISLLTGEIALKEGMYVQKGQSVLTVFNPGHAWVLLSVYGEYQWLVKTGNAVRIIPETAPEKNFRAMINYIEPFFRKDSKTLTVRVYFDNSKLKIPVGSQVRATIFGNSKDAYWLSKEAVLSLGMEQVVFLKSNGGFRAHKITTGIQYKNLIQVRSGLQPSDSVASNAQFLMDSESFIKVKQ
jgi:Cu(I)/Ag(I) efflux system membrane fusion protein